MAVITKGYAFAYQVLGKYVWESKEKAVTEEILLKFDEALERYVYDKIWSELSDTDKWYLKFIAQKSTMETGELLALTQKNKMNLLNIGQDLEIKALSMYLLMELLE